MSETTTIKEKWWFWAKANFIIAACLCFSLLTYVLYEVYVNDSFVIWRLAPRIYSDTDFLLEEFNLAYRIEVKDGKGVAVLRADAN